MKQLFPELNRNQARAAFERFISTVLSRKAIELKKDIEFNRLFENEGSANINTQFVVDAYAPNGFDSDIPTFFEFKTNINNNKTIDNILSRFSEGYKLGFYSENSKFIIITYSDVDKEYIQRKYYDKQFGIDFIQFEIWGKTTIDLWIEEYPIDYQNTIARFTDKDITIKSAQSNPEITQENFEKKNESNIALLKDEINTNNMLALVLGAGVSKDIGAKGWEELLKGFEDELCKKEQFMI